MCEGPAPAGPARATPRWRRLYGIVALGVAALIVVQVVAPPGLRVVGDGTLAAVLVLGMAVWVHGNRVALEQQEACACAWERTTVRVVGARVSADETGR